MPSEQELLEIIATQTGIAQLERYLTAARKRVIRRSIGQARSDGAGFELANQRVYAQKHARKLARRHGTH